MGAGMGAIEKRSRSRFYDNAKERLPRTSPWHHAASKRIFLEQVSIMYPKEMKAIYAGSEMTVVGRSIEGAAFTFCVCKDTVRIKFD